VGLKAGLAVKPRTPVQQVFPHLERLDRVLIMSVNPGWAGQEFLEEALPKIEAARAQIERVGAPVDIEVDGGINGDTASRCVAAGATVLAAASFIFKARDPASAASSLAESVGRSHR
jgi:ribulose-phosphate 3-epimerase